MQPVHCRSDPSQGRCNVQLLLQEEASNPDVVCRTLVAAVMKGWGEVNSHPIAEVRESIGQAGERPS